MRVHVGMCIRGEVVLIAFKIDGYISFAGEVEALSAKG